jgi:hypothetical protein
MDSTTILLCLIIAVLIAAFAAYAIWVHRKMTELESGKKQNTDSDKLKLAALERLTLFNDRSRLKNLVNRFYDPALSCREMQQRLVSSIREEYDYNITQQLYVKAEVWDALTKMKDQNMYIINQIAAVLPATASALDLNKKILEFDMNNPDSTMNNLVQQALQYEARHLL